MEKHVTSVHSPDAKDVSFICGICNHEFFEKDDYNFHVKIHDGQKKLILVNGHGYTKLIEEILKPHFESKISINMEDISKCNVNVLDVLGNKTTKRSNIKFSGGPTHLWYTKCDLAAKSRAALVKHNKANHALSSSSSEAHLQHYWLYHSTTQQGTNKVQRHYLQKISP